MTTKLRLRFAIIAVTVCFLSACSSDERAEGTAEQMSTSTSEKASESGSTSTGIVPKHQIDTLNRAKTTEALLLDADKKRREQLD